MFRKKRSSQRRRENAETARKSRFMGYVNAWQDITKKKNKGRTSTKESVLHKLKSMKDREFSMTIPLKDGAGDVQ